MIIDSNYVDSYLMPRITLEPLLFTNENLNYSSDNDYSGFSFSETQFKISYFKKARDIINSFKSDYNLINPTLFNTSRSEYLSSCVTQILGNYELNQTEIIDLESPSKAFKFLIGDHGFFRKTDLSIINNYDLIDDAWSINFDVLKMIGHSEKTHYFISAPKVFNIPFGGVLFCPKDCEILHSLSLDSNSDEYRFLSYQFFKNLDSFENYAMTRNTNFLYLSDALETMGLKVFFNEDFTSKYPGACILKSDTLFDEVKFKSYLNKYGIRGTSFFTNNAIILPCHQFLSNFELNYIIEVTKNALEESFS
jgi:hypothetical protein